MVVPAYRFGKGPIAVAVEDYLADRRKVLALLEELRGGFDPERSAITAYIADRYGVAEANHLMFALGMSDGGDSVAAAETASEMVAEGRQRQEVYGEGLRLAAHLAVGLAVDADLSSVKLDDLADTPNPVEVFWGCGHPFNQSWVSVRPWKAGLSIICLVFYSTQQATSLTRAILRDEVAQVGELPPVDLGARSLTVCHGDRADGGGLWFRPPAAMGIPDDDGRPSHKSPY